ncbi:MAG: cytochrome c3 family protein [Candidatus Riflebacteria bacterium]|nr:cytochrome c3 family protein [Candidatus Riflebacteria bacterium]
MNFGNIRITPILLHAKIAAFFYILAALSAYATVLEAFDHNAESSSKGCAFCHSDNENKYVISDNAWRWCTSCHSDAEKMSHQMKIQVKSDVKLPLDTSKKMDCLTCHTPHRERTSTEPWISSAKQKKQDDKFVTFMLVKSNVNGELCITCHKNGVSGETDFSMNVSKFRSNKKFAGSESCTKCHPEIGKLWKQTPHARMTRTPQNIPNFREIPVEGFEYPTEKIKYVLGSHYVYRFVAEATGTLVVLPKIYDLKNRKWLSSNDYGWRKRYWLKQCAGCHVTGFNETDDSFLEAGVGCEMCHGPGYNHSQTSLPAKIVNPARLSPEKREMICISCHTSGVDNSGKYHFPIGYFPGDDLNQFFTGLTPKPGQTSENFLGDESYKDRVNQWEFLKSRLFLAKGLTCDYCQNFRDFKTSGSDYFTHDEYCLTCHFDKTDHPKGNPSGKCTTCHIPTKTKSGAFAVHDHKFRF